MESNLYNIFSEIDIRVGKIVKVQEFPEAKNPSYKLDIDFSDELGIMKSSAQITNYKIEDLTGLACIAVVNLGKKQIGPYISECLILGSINKEGKVFLLEPNSDAKLGDRIY